MPSKVDLPHLSPSDFEEWIRTLEESLTDLRAEIRKAEERLAWARKGRSLFVPSSEQAGDAPSRPSEPSTPSAGGLNGIPPTLREAVLRVFLDRPAGAREPTWTANKVIKELERRGWMPNSERYA